MSARGPVANQFPTRESPYRISFVGESPGADEVRLGYPFAGVAGWCLNSTLSLVGLDRAACFVGNVCQWKPSAASNDFSLLPWEGDEVQSGIAQLLADLAAWRPNVVVCLGNVPLHLFKHGNVPPPRTPSGYQWPSKVTAWRGSLFLSSEQLYASVAGRVAVIRGDANTAARPSLESSDSVISSPPRGLSGCNPTAGTNLTASAPSPSTPQCISQGGVDGLLAVGRSVLPDGNPLATAPACPVCGGTILGDGYATSRCCENAERDGREPDADAQFCHAPRHKALATWHPAYVNRVWKKCFDLRQDLRRAREEGRASELELPVLNIEWGPESTTV